MQQRSIARESKVKGTGIHTGRKAELCFKPAEKDTGINFVRVDLPARPVIPACVSNVLEKCVKLRRTSLGQNGTEVHTVEHLLSALFGLGIDNIIIELNGEEVPALDGSTSDFCKILKQAKVVDLDSPKRPFTVKEPIWIRQDDAFLAIFPDDVFRISYTLNYTQPVLNQYINLTVTEESFLREIAACKTFCLENEINQLRTQGLGRGATEENTIVVGKKGLIKGNSSFSDEFARHKVLDLIGDFCLLASSINTHVVAVKSGHPLNIELLRRLDKMRKTSISTVTSGANPKHKVPPFDIEKIMQVLPHRYPFLLVDRVLEFEEGKHIVGVKNVTVNEQFFTGHFPGRPIMPGVLIIEAMAQTAGILMLSRLENRGKLAYFMSMDKVKFRKIVVPGDQLILKIGIVRIKSRTIQIRGLAYVDNKIVAEADLMFSLILKND